MELLYNLFTKNALKFPHRVAVRHQDVEVTYFVLQEKANELAEYFKVRFVKGTVIGVLTPSSVPFVTSMIAAFKAGMVYFPIESSLPKARIAEMLRETGCDVVIVVSDLGGEYLNWVNDNVNFVIELNALCSITGNINAPVSTPNNSFDREIYDSDPAYIYYTSGTTGMGKPIIGTHAGPANFINWQLRTFDITPNKIVSQIIQPTFDGSLRDFWVAFGSGGTVSIPDELCLSSGLKLGKWMEAHQIEISHCVPTWFKLITKELPANYSFKAFQSLKYVFMAGEQLYGKDIINWRRAGGEHVELINLYGSSEASMAQSYCIIPKCADPSSRISAGKPIDNCFMIILNESNELCRIGEMGDIYIKTPFLTAGYLNNVVQTSLAYVQNPLVDDKRDIVFKTGDIGMYKEDRSVEILGRKDSQVKINGIRANLKDIEKSILGMPDINDVVVVMRKNPMDQDVLVCYHTSRKITSSKIRTYLESILSKSIIPSFFIYIEKFPLSINGKIDTGALPHPDIVESTDENHDFPVMDDVESKLYTIWKETFAVKAINRNSAFFELGGTSIKAMSMISKVYDVFHKLLKIKDLYKYDTFGQMAYWIKNQTIDSKPDSVKAIEEQDHYGLSYGQQRLLILNCFEDIKNTYHIHSVFSIKGNVDKTALKNAIGLILNRYEILRTKFILIKNEFRQVPVQDISIDKVYQFIKSKDRDVNALIEREMDASISLNEIPLWRILLIQTDSDKFYLTIIMHHIISDGWSMNKFFEVFMEAYTRIGYNIGMSPLKVQYRDFSAWQNRMMKSHQLEKQRDYWVNVFKENIPKLEIKGQRPRPLTKSYIGKKINFKLGDTLYQKVKHVAEENETSTFVTLLTLVFVLLSKYSNQTSIVIGTSSASRIREELKDQIGFFVNNLPLFIRSEPGESFIDLLLKVKELFTSALDNQAYPLDHLVNEMKLERDLSRSPLFDVGVAMQDFESPNKSSTRFHGLLIEPYLIVNEASKFDFLFHFRSLENGCLGLQLEYNADLYELSLVDNIAASFEKVVSQCCGKQKHRVITEITTEDSTDVSSPISNRQ